MRKSRRRFFSRAHFVVGYEVPSTLTMGVCSVILYVWPARPTLYSREMHVVSDKDPYLSDQLHQVIERREKSNILQDMPMDICSY